MAGRAGARPAPTISPIDQASIHRICSGQVILDLAAAVKELVENAVDAGATQVDVTVAEYGAARIEVSDNGSGIDPSNHANICRKHWTSKLSSFEEITSLSSFGFRGEALSSLCALASVRIITRTPTPPGQADASGFELRFADSGELLSSQPAAREVGTTVLLSDLFGTLPVRRREFLKNVKREYARLLSLMQAYAIICTKIRIRLVHIDKAQKRRLVLATNGSGRLEDTVSAVYGAGQLPKLLPIDRRLGPAPSAGGPGAGPAQGGAADVSMAGFISRFAVSPEDDQTCRSAGDRQHLFINGRPVDLPEILRAINQVYRSLTSRAGLFPVVILDFRLPPGTVDVNATPDKRTVFIKGQKELATLVQEAISELAELSRRTFGPLISQAPLQLLGVAEAGQARSAAAAAAAGTGLPPRRPDPPEAAEGKADDVIPADDSDGPGVTGDTYRPPEDAGGSGDCKGASPACPAVAGAPEDFLDAFRRRPSDGSSASPRVLPSKRASAAAGRPAKRLKTSVGAGSAALLDGHAPAEPCGPPPLPSPVPIATSFPDLGEAHQGAKLKVVEKSDFLRMEVCGQFNLGFILVRLDQDLFVIDQHAADEKYRFEQLRQSTVMHVQPLLAPQRLRLSADLVQIVADNLQVFRDNGFHIDVVEQEEAEAPAGTSGSGSDSGPGPNLGSDPEALGSLPPSQPAVVYLKAVPFSRQKLFGADDIFELCALLKENPGAPARLPKVTAMLASRACRSAVMVGKALNRAEMTTIVRHMATMEQPWNCPHGRPTMRHLIDLAPVVSSDPVLRAAKIVE